MIEQNPEIIAHCPHCGVGIYSREECNGLPVPEYVCDCRLPSVASSSPYPYTYSESGTVKIS